MNLVEGRGYKLGAWGLVARRSPQGRWALYILDHPEALVFLVHQGLLFRSPLWDHVPKGCTTEDLEALWSREEVCSARPS